MKKALLASKARRPKAAQTNGSEFDTKQLLAALMAFKRGDFSARLPENWTGVPGKIADTFNLVIESNERMTRELERIVNVVGKEGRITERASLNNVSMSSPVVLPFPKREVKITSLVSQRHQRIDFRRAPRWNVTREQGDHDQ